MRTSRLWCVVAVFALAFMAACQQPDEGRGPPGAVGQPATPGKRPPGCSAATGKTGQLLPRPETVDPALPQIRMLLPENPCIPLAELASTVLEFVPEAKVQTATEISHDQKTEFSAGIKNLATQTADRALAAHQVLICGYDTDHLAIAVYQHVDHPWSVGVAAVIRGDFDAAEDITVCYIKNLVPRFPSQTRSQHARPQGPGFVVCGSMTRPTKSGEVYTVLVTGDSDQMCAFLKAAG